jgi:hypothetical protein
MIRASEPAREILQNTNICKIHGFVGPFTPGTNGAVRTQFTLSHAIPAAELIAVADRALYVAKQKGRNQVWPPLDERRMPRAPKRCLGTAPKFPCAVSELIQQNTDAEGTNLLSEFRCFRTERPLLHQARQLALFVHNGNLPMGRFAPILLQKSKIGRPGKSRES